MVEVCVMEKKMKEIIKRGYDLFACYKLNGKLDVCPCCVSEEEKELLLSVPVEKIPLDILSVYNTSAMPEKIEAVEYKYFLPRFLELINEFNFPAHSVEIALNRIAYVKTGEWTKEEMEFLGMFMKQFFKKCLRKYPLTHFETLEDVIIMLSKTGFESSWTVKMWEETNEFNALMHFVKTIASGVKMNRKGNLIVDNLLVIQNYTGEFAGEINAVYETLNCLAK
jgi:hypothetical protein